MNTQRTQMEFGDFQTPYDLARDISHLLVCRGVAPATIIEPTCGVGAFLAAALDLFPDAAAFGFEINADYVAICQRTIAKSGHTGRCQVVEADFFQTDWDQHFEASAEPLLLIGNPPWVTNSALGSIGSSNLPAKSNFHRRRGLDAMTGKSNFDISEWMLVHILERLDGREATMAMLCKTAVARKVLLHAWKNELRVQRAELYKIDARKHFDAEVDACLLICTMHPKGQTHDCQLYKKLGDASPQQTIGYHDDRMIADVDAYQRRKRCAATLAPGESSYRWRSGVKHDCSKVMELRKTPTGLVNGFDETVDIEDRYLFPMFKSSDVAKRPTEPPRKWMLVTQAKVGEETSLIETNAPKTWAYLLSHAERLDARRSTIYRKRPPFSVFGVGDYTFAPWKVAISGFYKSLSFAVIGPYRGLPVVFDDTVYAISCQTEQEAQSLHRFLMSDKVQEFYASQIFWDAKRPVTVELLSRLCLEQFANGKEQVT